MAVPELNGPEKRDLPAVPEAKLTPVQSLAAQLYGRGYTTPQIAERLVDHIVQNSRRDRATRLKMARNRLRKWSKTEDFRDAVYDTAVIALDMDSPQILAGISRKARAGRVDAAKLALELTGRHTPKGEAQPANVVVVFDGLPRPTNSGPHEHIIDLELEGEEDEEDDGT